IWSVLFALARPMLAVLRRARTFAAGARPPVLLGVRRAVTDPMVGLVTTGAVAVSLATFVYAATLSTSIDASLHEKAHSYVGGDVRVGGTSPPHLEAKVVPHSSIVTRGDATIGDTHVIVLGVDPKTFARATYWRGGYGNGDQQLAALAQPGAGGRLRVIVAGP